MIYGILRKYYTLFLLLIMSSLIVYLLYTDLWDPVNIKFKFILALKLPVVSRAVSLDYLLIHWVWSTSDVDHETTFTINSKVMIFLSRTTFCFVNVSRASILCIIIHLFSINQLYELQYYFRYTLKWTRRTLFLLFESLWQQNIISFGNAAENQAFNYIVPVESVFVIPHTSNRSLTSVNI